MQATRLDKLREVAKTITFDKIGTLNLDPASEKLMKQHRAHWPQITEDSAPGVLNNVIAGRICQFFDWRGKNYHIDSNFASIESALMAAYNELQYNTQIVVVVGARQKLNKEQDTILLEGLECFILTNKKGGELFAKPKYH